MKHLLIVIACCFSLNGAIAETFAGRCTVDKLSDGSATLSLPNGQRLQVSSCVWRKLRQTTRDQIVSLLGSYGASVNPELIQQGLRYLESQCASGADIDSIASGYLSQYGSGTTIDSLQPTSPPQPNFTSGIEFPVLNQASMYAKLAVSLVDSLRYHADPATEYVQYLLPIKTKAGRAWAMANARGSLSLHVRNAFLDLAAQIDIAAPYIESGLRKESTFYLTTELLSLREKIRDLLD